MEECNYFDYSELSTPMDIIIRLNGFERNTYREQEEAEKLFCYRLTEEVLVPLRKQIKLESNVDLVVTVTSNGGRKDERRISFHPNTADMEYFKDDMLYQVITRRERAVGSIYKIQDDASLVRMHYIYREEYEDYLEEVERKKRKKVSIGDHRKKRKIVRVVKRPSIFEINQIIAQSILRFRDEINTFIDDYFSDEQERPQIIGIFNRSYNY